VRNTVAREVRFEGRGLHSGESSTLAIHPAPPGSGRSFRRTDIDRPIEIPATAPFVIGTERATSLGRAGVRIDTVEHVMAALVGLGIDDARLELEGPEVPILDGSAQPFVDAIRDGGIRRVDAPRFDLVVRAPLEVRVGEARVRVEPAPALELSLGVEYPVVGRLELAWRADAGDFAEDLAGARVFGFAREVDGLRAAGRIRGARLDCVLLYDEAGPVNPEGVRFDDEVVRHKALDALGDLGLAGARLVGRYVGYRPGHTAHLELVRALRAARQVTDLVEARS